MPKPQKPCIFFGKFGFQTKEHVLARWLEQIFPRSSHDTHSLIDQSPVVAGKRNELVEIRKLQGRAHTKQVRVVCKHCNEGWLGDNQVKAKAALVPLIRGSKNSLAAHQQRDIALWAARAAMVAEYLDKIQLIPQDQRTWLMKNLEPPQGWFIWILCPPCRYRRQRIRFEIGSRRLDKRRHAGGGDAAGGVNHADRNGFRRKIL